MAGDAAADDGAKPTIFLRSSGIISLPRYKLPLLDRYILDLSTSLIVLRGVNLLVSLAGVLVVFDLSLLLFDFDDDSLPALADSGVEILPASPVFVDVTLPDLSTDIISPGSAAWVVDPPWDAICFSAAVFSFFGAESCTPPDASCFSISACLAFASSGVSSLAC